MNKLFVNNIGDLAEAQRASFYRFLSQGISEELSHFPNPIEGKLRIKKNERYKKVPCLIYLYINQIKLKGPNYSIETCLKRDFTYSIQLYVASEYTYSIDFKKRKSKLSKKKANFPSADAEEIQVKQDLFFGEIPLMTEEGTFIINGCERVVISQIIRSPGIYFQKEFNHSKKAIYSSTIISNRGIWTKFVLAEEIINEKNERAYIKETGLKELAALRKLLRQRSQLTKTRIRGMYAGTTYIIKAIQGRRIIKEINKLKDFYGLRELPELIKVLDLEDAIELKKSLNLPGSDRGPKGHKGLKMLNELREKLITKELLRVRKEKEQYPIKNCERIKKFSIKLNKYKKCPLYMQDLKEAEKLEVTLEEYKKTSRYIPDFKRAEEYIKDCLAEKIINDKVDLSNPKKTAEEQNKEDRREPKDEIYLKLTDFNDNENGYNNKEENDSNKIYIYDILQYFGLNFEELIDNLKYPSTLENQYLKSPLRELTATEDILNRVHNLIFKQRAGAFSIGEIGRYKINKRLGLNLPKDIHYLTVVDFLGIIDGLIELKYFNRESDDIDDLRNKEVRCVGELLQNQMRVGLYRLRKSLMDQFLPTESQKLEFDLEFDSISDLKLEDWLIDPRPVTSSIKEFFITSQLSQFMDQTNPLAELTHKRRISVFGPNGLKRDHISTVIRDIHPSQYGRLCPIETPEGQNAGLISSIALYGRIDFLGSIETPYFIANNGRIFSEKQPLYLDPDQEAEAIIGFCDKALNNEKRIEEEYISAKENYLFSLKKISEVKLVTTSPLQIVSLATALIPFLEHNDANRALMGSNMQRQAVPLLYTQKAIVGTGLEVNAILDSELVVKSYSQGNVIFASAEKIQIKDFSNQIITYYLRKYWRSNQETSINQKPIVWLGEEVFSGEIIADGPSTNDGELALGHNLTVAYMPWEGYNYEDAIVINERLLTENCLTSIHIEEHEISLNYALISDKNEKLTKNLKHLTKHIRRHLTKQGIVKIGSYVTEHDILVGKLTPCEEDPSPELSLLKALFGKIITPNYRDTSLRVPRGAEGRVIDIRLLSTTLKTKDQPTLASANETIRIYIAQIRKIQVGDKLAGRHGNKGIISRILSKQDMPYLPDGTPVDILLNPLGVPSRMNVGQVFECLLGFAGERLGKRYKVAPFDEIYGPEASRILVNQKLKEVKQKTNEKWVLNPYSPGKIFLRDGRTGEYFDNPITVGKSYILKLIHLVEDKIHARATGPYAMITEQPLAGKSQRGGQRFGEMEVWALEAYGTANTLQELLTIKSDDIDGRNDMYEAILVRKEIAKPNPSLPEAFIALIRELNALGLDFTMNKIENHFTVTTKVKSVEKDLFLELEEKLKLRALLAKKKAEKFSKSNPFPDETELYGVEKEIEKKKIIERLKKQKLI